MLAKPCATGDGKPRAPGQDMLNVDAIEAINFEQLVTKTDRLLVLGTRRVPKHRPSSNRIGPRCEPEHTVVIRRPNRINSTAIALGGCLFAFVLVLTSLA